MKRLFTLLILTLTFVVGGYAQNEVHIVQKTGTTVVNLDEVSSIELTEEPWDAWNETSGVYYFSLYVSGGYQVPVYYRDHLIDPTLGQFKIAVTEVGAREDILVNVNKETGACEVGVHHFLDHSKYGPVFVSDMPHYPLQPGSSYEKYPCTYDAKRGLFSFNLIYFVSESLGSSASGYFGNGVETLQLDGYYVPDYSFYISFKDSYVDADGANYAVIQTKKGVDVAKYLMTVVGSDANVDTTVQGMLDGTVACDTLTEAGTYNYPITASGLYRAVAVTFDAEENMLDTYSTEFEFWVADDANSWESIGYAKYTDDLILPLLGNPAMAYYVEVLENKKQPGLFRMVDPYGPEFPLYAYASSYDEGSYIEIDATDPEGVWIEGWQSTGLEFSTSGPMSITSKAWYQANTNEATKEEAKEAGLCGTYADGVITFPVKGLLVAVDSHAYYANQNGEFALDMTNLLESIPEEAATARTSKAKLGRIKANGAFEMPVKKSAEKKNFELDRVEPNVNAALIPASPVKFKKVDASHHGLVER